jgi:hypothetical protein
LKVNESAFPYSFVSTWGTSLGRAPLVDNFARELGWLEPSFFRDLVKELLIGYPQISAGNGQSQLAFCKGRPTFVSAFG